jgi:hypothetical protein
VADVGYYTLLQQGNQFECPAGRYTNDTGTYKIGDVACTACSAGTRSGPTGSRSWCVDCEIGKYQKDEGSAVCLPCTPGNNKFHLYLYAYFFFFLKKKVDSLVFIPFRCVGACDCMIVLCHQQVIIVPE